MIHIICDFERLDQSLAEYTVDSTSQYIEVRQAVQRFLASNNNDRNLTILVHSPIVANWLGDLRDYGPAIIDWQATSIRQRFQDRFGISTPSTLSGNVLVEHKILDWAETAIDQGNVEGSILRQLLSDVWLPNISSNSHFEELIQWSLSVSQPPVSLIPLMQFKLDLWKKIDKRFDIFDSASTLLDRSRQIVARWCLRDYPDSFIANLGIKIPHSLDISLDTIASGHATNILLSYGQDLDKYWRYRFPEIENPIDAVNEALRIMSGFSEAELHSLTEYLLQNPNIISAQLIYAIQSKFFLLSSLDNAISPLKNLIPLDIPVAPSHDADDHTMLTWVQDEYMPYFEWIMRSNQERIEQINLSAYFSEWLYSKYSEYVYDARSPLVTNLLASFDEFLSLNHLVFWVIVDGMTWWEGTLLAKLCRDTNLSVVDILPKIAALPSITSISKRAMVSGYLNTDQYVSNVQAATEELKKRYKTAFASTDIKTLRAEVNKANTGVFLWFYNELDAYHHKADDGSDEVVEGFLRRVLRELDQITQSCKRRGVRADVFVSSDHGCTRLPHDARRLETPKFATEWNEDEPDLDTSATRACSIHKDVAPTALDNLSNDWFVLQKDMFSLPSHFIVPKSYDYVGRRPRGWTHGGLSPEEVIVPFIHLQAQKVVITIPRIEVGGAVRANFMSVVNLEVTNPNDFELRNLTLTFDWGERRLVSAGNVPRQKKINQEIELPARAIEGKVVNLDYLLSYYVHGQENIVKGSAKLPVRRLMTSSIDDMFEE